jgi:hypothetical protein
MADRTDQGKYHATFKKIGPFWTWRGWHDGDDTWSSPWGRGIGLSKQSAIWAARRKMIGTIVRAHRDQANYLAVDGNRLVELADKTALQSSSEGQGGEQS